MKLLSSLVLVLTLLLASGCQNPEIMQLSPGVYQLARADHGGVFGNKDTLKAGVIRDANAYAESQGKVAIPVSAKEHPMGILADWASYEYVFKVVDKNSSEAKVPTMLVHTDSIRNGEFRNLGGKDLYYVAKPANDEGAPTAGPDAKPAVPTAQPKSTGDSLLELKKLLDAGAITKEEYDAKKKVLIDKL